MVSDVVEFERVAVASRVFALAAIVGLAVVFQNPLAIGISLVVAGMAAVAAYVTAVSAAPVHGVIAVEAGLAGAIVVTTLPDSVLLLPYLVVLPLLSGLARGIVGAALVIVCQLTAISTLTAAYGGLASLGDRAELLAPWALTIAGSGLLGASAKKLGKSPAGSKMDENYESARRLLGQLRTLARRLTSGLDPVTVASQMLDLVQGQISSAQTAVFVRTDGGVFAPLAYKGAAAREGLDPNHPLISECWKGAKRVTARLTAEHGSSAYLTAFPLRLGTEMVGVLLCRSTSRPPQTTEPLQEDLDRMSLPLATALAFEDVRAFVTADERQRLAREIHDGVAQEVASLGYVVDELADHTSDPDVTDGLNGLRGELSRIVTDLRLSIFDLRTGVTDSAGLGSALSDYVRKVGARSAMTVHLTLDEATTRLSPGVETELFRIAQEAITNARKHSHAENLWVDCWVRPPSARIRIRDDGRGLGASRSDSYGLRIMRERAEGIQAEVTINAYRGADQRPGTCVTISLGADEQADAEGFGAAS